MDIYIEESPSYELKKIINIQFNMGFCNKKK